jgi:multidrug efflux pump subunit AcrA (membrane-fusion protein)
MIPGKVTSFVLATFSTIFLAACGGGNTNETAVVKDVPVMITVAKPGENTTGTNIIASGVVEAAQTANISTRVMGYINKIYVKVGDHVNAGQLLVSINSNDIVAKRAQTDAMISQAQAALANAQKDYDEHWHRHVEAL